MEGLSFLLWIYGHSERKKEKNMSSALPSSRFFFKSLFFTYQSRMCLRLGGVKKKKKNMSSILVSFSQGFSKVKPKDFYTISTMNIYFYSPCYLNVEWIIGRFHTWPVWSVCFRTRCVFFLGPVHSDIYANTVITLGSRTIGFAKELWSTSLVVRKQSDPTSQPV